MYVDNGGGGPGTAGSPTEYEMAGSGAPPSRRGCGRGCQRVSPCVVSLVERIELACHALGDEAINRKLPLLRFC